MFRIICLLIGCLMLAQADVESSGRLQIAGVSHVTITVSNLTSSIRFYTNVLGGMVAEEMSMLEPTASREYIDMLTRGKAADYETCREDEESNDNCESLSSSLQVSWAFIIFDNLMVQLVQYTTLTGAPFVHKSDGTGNASPPPPMPHMDMMGTKLAFWVMDTVNMTEYANTLEEQSLRLGFNKVKFMRPILLADTADNRDANEGVHSLRDDTLKGLSIGYATGPDGESLKFIQLVNSSRESFNKHYCVGQMVSSALLDKSYVDRCGEYKGGHSSQLYGVNHISINTMDINSTLSYYVDKMGGYLVDDVQPSNLQSPSLQKLLMKFKKAPAHMMATGSDDLQAAKATMETTAASADDSGDVDYKAAFKAMQMKNRVQRSADDLTSDDITDASSQRVSRAEPSVGLNLRYVLLSNIKIEIAFLSGLPDSLGTMLSRLHIKSTADSFMKPGSMEIAFTFHNNESFSTFVNNSQPHGEGVENSQVHKLDEGVLQGLEYAVVVGPANEPIRLVHYSGLSRRKLHTSLRDYGSVSAIFSDTNPWNYNGYEGVCSKHLQ